jgi:hypothetical protein
MAIEEQMQASVERAGESAEHNGELLDSITLPFSHTINTTDTQQIVSKTLNSAGDSIAVSGIEYRQDDIYGQFAPDAVHTFAWFTQYYQSVHKTTPEIYGIVVGFPTADKSGKSTSMQSNGNSRSSSSASALGDLSKKVMSLSSAYPLFDAPKADFSTSVGTASNTTNKSTNILAASTANDWAASRLQLSLLRQTGTSTIHSDNLWYPNEGRNIRNMPDDWALEFDFKSYASNTLNSASQWHTVSGTEKCGTTNAGGFHETTQGQYFQQREAIVSEVEVLTGTNGDIEPYFDNLNYSDSCEALDTTMGIGKPKNVSGSTPRVKTNIVTAEGGTADAKNDFIFYYQAVSNDCLGTATASCTGLQFNRKLPGCTTEAGDRCAKDRVAFTRGQYKPIGIWAWRATQPWSSGDGTAKRGPCSGWQSYPYILSCPA